MPVSACCFPKGPEFCSSQPYETATLGIPHPPLASVGTANKWNVHTHIQHFKNDKEAVSFIHASKDG